MKTAIQIILIVFAVYCILVGSSNLFYQKVAYDDYFAKSLLEAAREEEKTKSNNFLLAETGKALVMGEQMKRTSIYTISLSAIVIYLCGRNLYTLKRRKESDQPNES